MPRGPSTPTLVARARAALPQVPRDHGAEFQHPAPHRLIGDIEPTFSEELFHIAVAQGEPEIKPNRMLDDRRREAIAAIREMDHARTLSDRLLLSDPGCRDIAGQSICGQHLDLSLREKSSACCTNF